MGFEYIIICFEHNIFSLRLMWDTFLTEYAKRRQKEAYDFYFKSNNKNIIFSDFNSHMWSELKAVNIIVCKIDIFKFYSNVVNILVFAISPVKQLR